MNYNSIESMYRNYQREIIKNTSSDYAHKAHRYSPSIFIIIQSNLLSSQEAWNNTNSRCWKYENKLR